MNAHLRARQARDQTGQFGPSRTPLYVRFADVDMMQVVHHAAYLHWLEQIRFRFLGEVLGVSFADLREAGLALPLTSCEMQYWRSLRFTDRPVGYARVECARQARFAVHYAVYDGEDGELAFTAKTTHCFLGAGHQLVLNWPPLFRAALERTRERFPEALLLAPILEVSP